MPWLPQFLNWQSALIASALAIPALLVLYFLKLRRREMPVGSTLLWRKAITDLQVNAPFQKLRRNLLLLLQLILLALLLLALSRPVSNYTPGPGKTTVILIDRSASMSAKDVEGGVTRLAEAKRRATDLVSAMGRDSTAMVIAFDDSAEMLQPFTSDVNLLKNAIERVQPTDRRTNLRLAYQLAEAQVNFDPEQLRANIEPPDVRLYSDGRVLEAGDLRIKAKVSYEKIGADASGNVGVVALSAKRNYERPTQVQVFARLANFGPEPVETTVQLSVDGQSVDTDSTKLQGVYLLPERWDEAKRAAHEATPGGKRPSDSVEFKLELSQAAVIKVEQQHKENDLLAADDVAQVVVPPPKNLSVLLVTDGNYFLERAVRSLSLKKPDVTGPASYEEKMPGEYDVIIFDNYKPKWMPEAGNFLWFGQVPDGIKVKVATDAPKPPTTGPAPAGPVAATPGGKPIIIEDVGVLDWKREHPILQNLALSKLYVARALKLDVPLDKEVLIDGLKGPLVVLDRTAKNVHLMVAFDVLQSNWPLKTSFPVFMHNVVQFLAVGTDMDVRQSFDPGASPRVPRANLAKAGSELKKVNLDGPGGRREVVVPDAGDFVLPPLNRAGLYTTDPPIPQFEQLAVNLLDANESNLLPAGEPPGEIGEAIDSAGGKSRFELWRVLAAAALVVLFVEWWVYTRRVHL